MSLRLRLVAVLLAVLAAGLAVAGVATYESFRSFLTRRVDQQLDDTRGPATGRLLREVRTRTDADTGAPSVGNPPMLLFRAPRGNFAPSGTYAELRDASGATLAAVTLNFTGESAAAPVLPPTPAASSTAEIHRFFTATARRGPTRYRVLEERPAGSPATLFVAVPLREVSASLHRLLLAEIGVSLAALFVVGAIATWLVRLSLRPLDRMALTADEIAAGDLSRRVDNDSGRGEVGRLGHALNEMLHQIEAAFDARQRSEDELRRSEERLRRFVADASHELRTPLTSIRGHAELFRRGGNADPVALAQSMRRIESEAQRMGVLVDDLLLLARIDEGLPLAREPVDLARVAADAVADARAVHPERQVDLDADHVVVTGDDARLHQLVANLLANALIHTPSGTDVQVRVGTEGDDAVLCVADDGPGLSPEQAARVFERFYRADPSRSRANGGTGLGLSIVAAVAEAHGGRVSVDTAPGEGATFRVQLPKERVPQKV